MIDYHLLLDEAEVSERTRTIGYFIANNGPVSDLQVARAIRTSAREVSCHRRILMAIGLVRPVESYAHCKETQRGHRKYELGRGGTPKFHASTLGIADPRLTAEQVARIEPTLVGWERMAYDALCLAEPIGLTRIELRNAMGVGEKSPLWGSAGMALTKLLMRGLAYDSGSRFDSGTVYRVRTTRGTRGRPKARINLDEANRLIASGHSTASAARKLGVSTKTLRRRMRP